MQRNGNIRCYIICLHHNRKIIVNEISWISIRWTSKIPNRYIENESTFSIFWTAIQSQNTVSSNYIDLTFSKLNQISKAFENNKLWLKLAQCTLRIIQLEQQHIELCRLFNHHKISLCVLWVQTYNCGQFFIHTCTDESIFRSFEEFSPKCFRCWCK